MYTSNLNSIRKNVGVYCDKKRGEWLFNNVITLVLALFTGGLNNVEANVMFI